MPAIATKIGAASERSGGRHPVLRRLLALVIPAANPDFELLYSHVRLWWIELDAKGVPQRELGFNANGTPIVAGPLGRNCGFWTDSSMTFALEESTCIDEVAFATAWQNFEHGWSGRNAKSVA